MPTPREALENARQQWNAGSLDGYLELYDDRIQLHGLAPEPLDKPGVRAFYQGMWDAFDDRLLEFQEVLEDGDTLAVRFTLTARHTGEFMGIPPTERPIVLPGLTTMRFEGDRVVERHTIGDMLGLMVQLGAVPAPA